MTVAIPALPTPVPQSTDPINFDARADAFLGALPATANAMNAQNAENNTLNANVNTKADQVALDRTATGADRVQTGLDRTATAASAAASEASRVASGVSATASQASANNAASAVVSQLTALKTQTETARDEAVAGLGAADQSASLVQLVNGIAYNTDITGQLYNEIYNTDGVQNRTLPYVLETIVLHMNLLFDLAGAAGKWPMDDAETEKAMQALAGACAAALDIGSQAARQVNGGSVQLESGTVTQPSLWPSGDRNTGLLFPGADALALATAGLERLRLDANGRLGLGTNAPTGLLDVADDKLRIRTAKTPATATEAGNAGEFCWDASYLYVCTATNQWRRSALATW